MTAAYDFASRDATAAFNAAATGINAARACGLSVPASIVDIEANMRELRRLQELPTPAQPVLPPKRDGYEKVLRSAAHDLVEHDAVKALAADAWRVQGGALVRCFKEAGPDWIAALVEQFAEALDEFTTALPAAPWTLNGHEDEDTTAAYMAVARSSSRLDTVVAYRAAIGSALGEEGAGSTSLWGVSDLPQMPRETEEFNRRWPELVALVRAYGVDMPKMASPERWRALTDQTLGLPISLASYGEVEARIDRYASLTGAAWAVNGLASSSGFDVAFTRAYPAADPVHYAAAGFA